LIPTFRPELSDMRTGREAVKDPNDLSLLEFAEQPFFIGNPPHALTRRSFSQRPQCAAGCCNRARGSGRVELGAGREFR
jgi:hypothetical protein